MKKVVYVRRVSMNNLYQTSLNSLAVDSRAAWMQAFSRVQTVLARVLRGYVRPRYKRMDNTYTGICDVFGF